MSFLRPNLILQGTWRKATYTALRHIRKECPKVWLGQRSDDKEHVILKEGHDSTSFDAETNALNGYLRGHSSFRQLVDLIPDQKLMVFEYLAESLHDRLYKQPRRKFKEEEMKRVALVVLKGLATMHEEGFAHTDIKLSNVVVDFDQQGKFTRIKLIDLGDSVKIEPTTDHVFSHPIYKPPEGLLGLPWTTKVDIWGLGTMIMEALMGGRVFDPGDVDQGDEDTYRVTIAAIQDACFGPLPTKAVRYFFDDDESPKEILDAIERFITLRGGREAHRNTLAFRMSTEALDFLDRLMKLDPRDRPSAQDLLQDPWFSGVIA